MNRKAWESRGRERERKEVGGGGRLREDDSSNRKENHLIFQKG